MLTSARRVLPTTRMSLCWNTGSTPDYVRPVNTISGTNFSAVCATPAHLGAKKVALQNNGLEQEIGVVLHTSIMPAEWILTEPLLHLCLFPE